MLHLREIDAHGEAQKAVNPSHPVSVALREIIVYRNDVHAFAGERIKVGGQRCHQRLALAGAHLRNLSVMQRDAANHLHIEMPHVEHAPAGLAHHGKRLGQQFIQRLAIFLLMARFQLVGLGAQFGVAEFFDLRLERVDGAHHLRVFLHQPVITAAEYLSE